MTEQLNWTELNTILYTVVVPESLSHVWLFITLWTIAPQASLSITTPRAYSNHVHCVTDTFQPLILCRHLLLPPSVFLSIRVFWNESVFRVRWPNYWNFSFSISPSNEYSGLISFRMNWLDFLAVQGTLKSLLQHRSSKASILNVIVQLSHPYMTTRKTIDWLDRPLLAK